MPGVRLHDDNWGAARAEFDGIDMTVLDVARRGPGVGVVITTNRWVDIRTALRDTFPARFELRLGDPSEFQVHRRAARHGRRRAGPGPGPGW